MLQHRTTVYISTKHFFFTFRALKVKSSCQYTRKALGGLVSGGGETLNFHKTWPNLSAVLERVSNVAYLCEREAHTAPQQQKVASIKWLIRDEAALISFSSRSCAARMAATAKRPLGSAGKFARQRGKEERREEDGCRESHAEQTFRWQAVCWELDTRQITDVKLCFLMKCRLDRSMERFWLAQSSVGDRQKAVFRRKLVEWLLIVAC